MDVVVVDVDVVVTISVVVVAGCVVVVGDTVVDVEEVEVSAPSSGLQAATTSRAATRTRLIGNKLYRIWLFEVIQV